MKFDFIGFSIISPEELPVELFLGLAIKPLIPANCFIWSWLPRAPESAIIYNGLKPWSSVFNSLNISFATSAVACVHTSIVLLYLSPSVRICFLNFSLIPSTTLSAAAIISFFDFGIWMSSIAIDRPPLDAASKPKSFNPSKNCTVLKLPNSWYDLLIIWTICFFPIILFWNSKLSGRTSLNMILPSVVSINFPSNLNLTLACREISSLMYANFASV